MGRAPSGDVESLQHWLNLGNNSPRSRQNGEIVESQTVLLAKEHDPMTNAERLVILCWANDEFDWVSLGVACPQFFSLPGRKATSYQIP